MTNNGECCFCPASPSRAYDVSVTETKHAMNLHLFYSQVAIEVAGFAREQKPVSVVRGIRTSLVAEKFLGDGAIVVLTKFSEQSNQKPKIQ